MNQGILHDQPAAYAEKYENSYRYQHDRYPCPNQPSAQFRYHSVTISFYLGSILNFNGAE
jgi:hypothetical protein